MEIGKIPNDILKEIILGKIKQNRKEVIVRPGIGEDCCALDFGEYACIMSSDPITGAVNEIGSLAVHISCNDIASCGVEPIGLIVTILAPPGTNAQDLELLMRQICDTANALNVEIIGGHTEITDSVNRFVVSTTAVGRALKDKIITTSGAQDGDSLIITKTAGTEGTAIIAHDKEDELIGVFGKEFVDKAKGYIERISVIKEGMIAGDIGANSMHDVTEGGVLGAVWEMAEASGLGVDVFRDRIPVGYETEKICSYFNIDPLKLISSGCMLIASDKGEEVVRELENVNIKASIIGRFKKGTQKLLFNEETYEEIYQPVSDELYKVI